MKRIPSFLPVLCAALILPARAAVAAERDSNAQDTPLAQLLAAMPAESVAEQQEAGARLVQLGPAAVVELCGMLVPPGSGDDTRVRYAIDGLSTYSHRAGAERERLMVAGCYIQALEKAEPTEVRAFLIRQLERVGREESLAALAEFLTDPGLGEPAARALVAIGTPGASRRLLKALPLVKSTRKVTIMNGLGTLRAEAATRELMRQASSDEPQVVQAALTALAEIGDPSTESIFEAITKAESPAARRRADALYLRYAKRLAESGNAAGCVRICRQLIRARQVPRESHVACQALSTLVEAVGSDAADDVLEAMKSEYPDVRGVAYRLALKIPGTDFTARCVEVMQNWTLETRAGIIDMLGRRGDRTALPAVREALAGSYIENQADVQFAAIQALGRLTERPVLTVLVEEISRGDSLTKQRLIPFLARFGGGQALGAVVEATKSEDASVRGWALQTLANWPEPNALEPLLVAFREADHEDRRLRDSALGAYMRLVGAAGRSQEAVLELYKDALAAARHPGEKKVIIGGLGRLKSRPSLELVQTFFDDDDLRQDAVAAAVSIIKPRQSGRGGLRGRRVMAALESAIAITESEAVRKEAQDLLEELKDRAQEP